MRRSSHSDPVRCFGLQQVRAGVEKRMPRFYWIYGLGHNNDVENIRLSVEYNEDTDENFYGGARVDDDES